MNQEAAAAERVTTTYKTGDYIGEIVQREERRVLVKVLAVVKHPTQGDLHSPYDPDAAMFHERRALSYTEKVWVPTQTVKPYGGAVPEYRESLRTALEREAAYLDGLRRWAERCLGNLAVLRQDYRLEQKE